MPLYWSSSTEVTQITSSCNIKVTYTLLPNPMISCKWFCLMFWWDWNSWPTFISVSISDQVMLCVLFWNMSDSELSEQTAWGWCSCRSCCTATIIFGELQVAALCSTKRAAWPMSSVLHTHSDFCLTAMLEFSATLKLSSSEKFACRQETVQDGKAAGRTRECIGF